MKSHTTTLQPPSRTGIAERGGACAPSSPSQRSPDGGNQGETGAGHHGLPEPEDRTRYPATSACDELKGGLVPDEVNRIYMVVRDTPETERTALLTGTDESGVIKWLVPCPATDYGSVQQVVHKALCSVPSRREAPLELVVSESAEKTLTVNLPRWAASGWRKLDGNILVRPGMWKSIHARLNAKSPSIAVISWSHIPPEDLDVAVRAKRMYEDVEDAAKPSTGRTEEA